MYGQTDTRWRNEKLGQSKKADGTIGNIGCTLTAICNLHNRVFGTDMTPSYLNKLFIEKGVYVFDAQGYSIVLWGNVQRALPKLRFVYRDFNYNNAIVWTWINISPRLPVIVVARTPFAAQHFFLFIGGGRMVDSLDGREKSTSMYPTLIGSARLNRA